MLFKFIKKVRNAKKQKNKNERMMLLSLILSGLSVILMFLQLTVAIIALFLI